MRTEEGLGVLGYQRSENSAKVESIVIIKVRK